MTKAEKIMKDKKAIKEIADNIIELFKEKKDDEGVEYNWYSSGGKMVGKQSNTFFSFDTKSGTKLDEFKKSLFDEDLENVEEGSKEEEELLEKTKNFILKVCKEISEKHTDDLRDTIRRVVLGGKSDPRTIPLETIELIMIDIADYSSVPEPAKYLLKIEKDKNVDIQTDEITQFIHEKQEKSEISVFEAFALEKMNGNPLFKDVKNVTRGSKFLNEITIYMFVDYSFAVPSKTS